MGLNSIVTGQSPRQFVSHRCLLIGENQKSIWLGWDEANENASEPKGSLSQGGEQGRNGACGKELVSYTPVPTLRKKEKDETAPIMPHPTHITPHPQQHLSAPSLLPAMPG